MTNIELTPAELIVHVAGADRFWTLKSELRVPLSHVSGAEPATDEARRWWHGLRTAGTHVPGIITAGTYHESEGRVFWDIHDPEGAIAIRLHDECFVKLVVEVADPAATIAAVASALARRLESNIP